MLTYERGDIITGDYPIFCHQVNCKGVMGSGIARAIKSKYPEVFEHYSELCKFIKPLGAAQAVELSDGRVCVNLFGQDRYGRDKRYTDYTAFKHCLIELEIILSKYPDDTVVAFPYAIGCGLAGGDWNIIQGMIKDFSEKVNQKVVIVSLK